MKGMIFDESVLTGIGAVWKSTFEELEKLEITKFEKIWLMGNVGYQWE